MGFLGWDFHCNFPDKYSDINLYLGLNNAVALGHSPAIIFILLKPWWGSENSGENSIPSSTFLVTRLSVFLKFPIYSLLENILDGAGWQSLSGHSYCIKTTFRELGTFINLLEAFNIFVNQWLKPSRYII